MLALWIAKGLGAFWRHAAWHEAGGSVRRVAEALGGQIRPLWTGWRVEAPGVRVDWRGGLAGERTRVVIDGQKHEQGGWLGADAVAAIVERARPKV